MLIPQSTNDKRIQLTYLAYANCVFRRPIASHPPRARPAGEAAQKAPIKMVFPLAVCIFPAILIAAAGPGLLATMHALGGS